MFFIRQKLKWCWRKESREGDINVFSGASTFPMQVIFLSAGDDRPPQGQTTLPLSIGSLLSYSLLHSLSSLRNSLGLVT